VVHQVWGTHLNVQDEQKGFRKFFDTYKDEHTGEALYPRLLDEAVKSDTNNMNIDCTHIYSFDPVLYQHLVMYPTEIIPLYDIEINKKALEIDATREQRMQVQVQFLCVLLSHNHILFVYSFFSHISYVCVVGFRSECSTYER